MNLLNCKKGLGKNIFAAIIFLCIFGFLTIFAYLLVNSFITEMDNNGLYDGAIKVAGDKFLTGMAIFDYATVLIMVVLIIGIGVTSYKIASPPVFFLIQFFFAAVYGFVSYFFSYLFSQLVSDSVFTATLLFFPNTILICTNLHWVALVLLIVGAITLYGKKDQGQFV